MAKQLKFNLKNCSKTAALFQQPTDNAETPVLASASALGCLLVAFKFCKQFTIG
jgi:hypothetical protein